MVNKISPKNFYLWSWIILSIVFLGIYFISGAQDGYASAVVLEIIIAGILSFILLLLFLFIRLILKDHKNSKFPIKGLKWIPYVVGLFLGLLQPVFWIYQSVWHVARNYGENFFSIEFHRRTYYWGWAMIALFVLAITFGILFSFIEAGI